MIGRFTPILAVGLVLLSAACQKKQAAALEVRDASATDAVAAPHAEPDAGDAGNAAARPPGGKTRDRYLKPRLPAASLTTFPD